MTKSKDPVHLRGSEVVLVPQPALEGEDVLAQEEFEETPYLVLVLTMITYAMLSMVGHIRDILKRKSKNLRIEREKLASFPPLYSDFDAFYTRNIYVRIRDCFNKPVTSCASGRITLAERYSVDFNHNFRYTGRGKDTLNLGSYNYLGFAETTGACAEAAIDSIVKYGITTSSPRVDLGTQDIHQNLEELVAAFVRKPAAIIVGMGFATNSTTIPMLVGKGDLVLSDQLNHASIVLGARLSGAAIWVFKHNDIEDLEKKLRRAHAEGQPRTHRPWGKIMIVVEGIYSMEGSILRLPDIVRLKKQYKTYLFLDEAHSIGALGRHGRGVVEHYGLDPADIDIMMGTFTKSFGAAGGYCAATEDIIAHMRRRQHASVYACSMSPPVVVQTHTSMRIIAGVDGTDNGERRIRQLAENCQFFRSRLKAMGFIVYGNDLSPIVPMMLFMPARMGAFGREMENVGVSVVVVGFPATPIVESRVRFCISASHSREELEDALRKIDRIGGMLGLKYSHGSMKEKNKALPASSSGKSEKRRK